MGMLNNKPVIFALVVSTLLIILIGWWIDRGNTPQEVLLGDVETLDGPLTSDELEIDNPVITNNMNRIATFNTNKGIITLELFEDTMPITTGNFIKLAEEGFYDGSKFHRIIDNFMIQGGDPNSKSDDSASYGTGGPSYTIQDEFIEGEFLSNVRGTISMANTGQPNSGGSQFFINTVDNFALDFDKEPFSSKHPVFGRVIKGMDVVDIISDVETTTGNNLPIEPVIIESIVISEAG